jgi:hypothetical protein
MKLRLLPVVACAVAIFASAEIPPLKAAGSDSGIDLAQVPKWSRADLEFFLHGTMSTEVVPERVLQAFVATYPDLFPSKDLSNFGLLPDASSNLPIGVSRRAVPHLAGLPSIGVNCAACHVGEITFVSTKQAGRPLRILVLGMTSHFDAEAFLGAVIVATFRTSNPTNMQSFLANYLAASDPQANSKAHDRLASEWNRQEDKIIAAIASDPFGSQTAETLHAITADDVRLDAKLLETEVDLSRIVRSLVKLFHNMRAALHVPDQPPPPSPPNGPGRNDPWRILSYSLLGAVTKPAPVKFGIVWNESQRTWVHVDANTRSPIIRNLAASLGLGAPLLGHTGAVDFAAMERHTALSELIRPPRYPAEIDRRLASRGAKVYRNNCASCHDGPASDQRLHAVAEIKTDPNRAEIFTPGIAEQFNRFFAELEIPGYRPPEEPIRGTGQYWAPSLAGVWARSPYLHNGSVRTMMELLTPSDARAKMFHRGSHLYDSLQMGYADDGPYVLNTSTAGNSNAGHDFGTDLSDTEKRELIEYLKTL